ncbi:glutamate ABC transporter substrate-binding protein [Streptomyces sp. Z26]|uniref:glutamate ABC transporter substrate-binding protein n=1 Tax=Streptomyces sp. Z26 TaxID=2500177 RepID=UPI000EF13D42|nr:glutamate ABC transporter substrate-binding protein [Streptomyces sp. Z26]RLL66814.1 glutamate ABC transporter substrate-binding protein [Streptomyces sp. Z26]
MGPKRRERRWAVAVSGLAVAATALAPALLPGGTGDRPDDRAGHGRLDEDPGGERAADGGTDARPASAPRAPAAPAAPDDPKPEREVCADGSDPAASLKPSGADGEAVKRIKDRGRLVVGVDQNSYLWGYRDPATGDLEGFDIDLVKAIAEDILGDDAEITYKTIPTDQRIPAIQDGEVDMVVRTMTINCSRAEEVAFSNAYFESGQQLLVPQSSPIDGINESITRKRICIATGSTAEEVLNREEYPLGAVLVKVPNQLDCLVRVQVGEADAVLTDNALGAGQAAQDSSVQLVGGLGSIEPYGVAMHKDDKDLVRRVNKVLDDYTQGGGGSKWSASYEKWLAEIIPDDDPKPPAPIYSDD